MSGEAFDDAVEGDLLDPSQARVVWNVVGRAVTQSVLDFDVPDVLGVDPVRRVGTYPEAPNRISTYPVVRDGYVIGLTCESRLEMGWLRALHMSQRVDWLMMQPFVLAWFIGSQGAYAMPDVLARVDGFWSVFDVKPDDHAADEATRRRFALMRHTLSLAEVPHRVLGDLSDQAKVNLAVISTHKRPNPALDELVGELRTRQPRFMASVVEMSPTAGVAKAALFHLIANGECTYDLDHGLTASTRLTWGSTFVQRHLP